MGIYAKLIKARKEFLADGMDKTGRTSMYKYFSLDDIVPKATKVFSDNGLCFVANTFNATENTASGVLVDTDDGTSVTFTTNFPSDGQLRGQNAYQQLGSGITYMRRYLYMMVLDIVEADAMEEEIGKGETAPQPAPKKEETIEDAYKNVLGKLKKKQGGQLTQEQKDKLTPWTEGLKAKDPKILTDAITYLSAELTKK